MSAGIFGALVWALLTMVYLNLRIHRQRRALREAWAIIANVSGGDWGKQAPEWEGAARRWRDSFWGWMW